MRLKSLFLALLLTILLLSSCTSASALLPESEEDVQLLAEEIQTNFGITLLYGDACKNIETVGFSMGEEPMGRSPMLKLLGQFNYTKEFALISSCLAVYPPNLFEQFVCDEAPLGLRILLVNRLIADDTNTSVAGVTIIQDGYYNIFLGIGAFNSLNLHHELWHAMDYRITFEFPEAFSSWNDLNPPGFEYDNAYFTEDIWTGVHPRDEWFVRNYSVINEMEDRATVIEAVFQHDTTWWVEHPLIQRKLDAILDAAHPVFGDLKVYMSGDNEHE